MMIFLCLSSLLLLAGANAFQDYCEYGFNMVQTQKPTGVYLNDHDGNELFHVDLDNKRVVYSLPDLEKYISFDPDFSLQNLNILKYNLGIYMKRTNNTPATSVPPIVRVYPEYPVVLGEPNILICSVTNIFPPVMNMTWRLNGEKIASGVTESIFLSSQDHSLRKFFYLSFIPTRDDIYTCEVEHWGLDNPTRILWYPQVAPALSEATETVICALGLFVGFVGVVVGAVLIIKGMRLNAQRRRRGN